MNVRKWVEAILENVRGHRNWLIILFLSGAIFQPALIAQDEKSEFQVGDVIEFDFFGRRQRQSILEIRPNGVLRVEVDSEGKKVTFPVQPKNATLVQRKGVVAVSDDYRTWTDVTGKFTVEAAILEVSEREVKLLKQDDLVISLPIEKLSQADQLYLVELKEKKDALGAARGLVYSPELENKIRTAFANGEFPCAPNRVKTTNEVKVQTTAWRYIPTDTAKYVRDQTIPFPDTFPKDDSLSMDIFQNGNQTDIINIQRSHYETRQAEILLIDTTKAEIVGQFLLPAYGIKDIVVSPTVNTMATLHESARRHSGGIVFWKIDNDHLLPTKAWEFDSVSENNRFSANSMMFIDEQHILTIGSDFALWDWESGTCVYSISKPRAWAISRDYSHLAFEKNNALWLMKISDGSIVGQISDQSHYFGDLKMLDFSPDGKSLVSSDGRWLFGFDLTNGQGKFSIEFPQQITSVEWADNSLLFLNNNQFYSPTSRATVWEVVVSIDVKRAYQDSTSWIVAPDRLFSLELVNEERRAAMSGVADIEGQSGVLTFEPGTKIAIKTELQHLPSEDATIRALHRRVEELGFVVDENAPLVLEAKLIRFAEMSRNVRNLDGFVKFVPHTSHMILSLNGKTLRHRTVPHFPKDLERERIGNETYQEAANRITRPDPAFFADPDIPQKIGLYPSGKLVGMLRINSSGVYDQ